MNRFVLLLAFVCSGCVTAKLYDRKYEPVGAKGYVYSDQDIDFKYVPVTADSSIAINLKNKSSKTIKVIWDEVTLIGSEGQVERVFHEGIKIADRAQPMAPSIVPAGSTLTDSVTPVNKVDWVYNGWSYYPICGVKDIMTWEIDEVACLGKTFGLYFSYEIDGKKKNFTVSFRYLSKNEHPQKK
jgi:hypothetical protein